MEMFNHKEYWEESETEGSRWLLHFLVAEDK